MKIKRILIVMAVLVLLVAIRQPTTVKPILPTTGTEQINETAVNGEVRSAAPAEVPASMFRRTAFSPLPEPELETPTDSATMVGTIGTERWFHEEGVTDAEIEDAKSSVVSGLIAVVTDEWTISLDQDPVKKSVTNQVSALTGNLDQIMADLQSKTFKVPMVCRTDPVYWKVWLFNRAGEAVIFGVGFRTGEQDNAPPVEITFTLTQPAAGN